MQYNALLRRSQSVLLVQPSEIHLRRPPCNRDDKMIPQYQFYDNLERLQFYRRIWQVDQFMTYSSYVNTTVSRKTW